MRTLFLILLTLPLVSYAGQPSSCSSPSPCPTKWSAIWPKQVFPLPGPDPAGENVVAYASRNTSLRSDLSKANLVSAAQRRLSRLMGASGSITFTGADFANLASPGNSQLMYFSDSENVTFEMVIGSTNLTTAQTWTLPADLTNQLDVVQRRDYVNPSSIPASLRLAGVSNATKFSAANRLFVSYEQYQIGASSVNYLGYSVDRKVGLDYATPSVGAILASVPLQAGSNYISQKTLDDPADDTQVTISDTLALDGFGTLNTPTGSFQALRFTMKSGYRTYDLSGGGPPDLLDIETVQRVGWVTKEGHWIVADYADYDPTTKAATISQVQYLTHVPTSSLSPTFTNTCNCPR
jgi:hypothetical protein